MFVLVSFFIKTPCIYLPRWICSLRDAFKISKLIWMGFSERKLSPISQDYNFPMCPWDNLQIHYGKAGNTFYSDTKLVRMAWQMRKYWILLTNMHTLRNVTKYKTEHYALLMCCKCFLYLDTTLLKIECEIAKVLSRFTKNSCTVKTCRLKKNHCAMLCYSTDPSRTWLLTVLHTI